jgi:6-phosphogluconate dehydrogenase
MGANLARNIARRGYRVAVYNRSVEKTNELLALLADKETADPERTNIAGFPDLKEAIASLAEPKKVILMVKAGDTVDKVMSQVTPLLKAGDILVDGGNSHFADTERRVKSADPILFVGCGISGGELGALNGPSIMPGGRKEAWASLQEMLEAIAARPEMKADDADVPCVSWVGPGGAGHFVKMVHNGIEYGDMQLIAEATAILTHAGVPNIADVFDTYNKGVLSSYLIQITSEILRHEDYPKVLDTAGQKGTGRWTAVAALEHGMPLTLIGEAVFARCLSAMKDERVRAAKVYADPKAPSAPSNLVKLVEDAMFASKVISYAQGFVLMRAAAKENGWDLDYAAIARMWRGGCIIRSTFLNDITRVFAAKPDLENLILDESFFAPALRSASAGWRALAAYAVTAGIPIPAISSALAYFDGYRIAAGSASMIQAQRDYFGAHTYERVDKPRGEFFHTNWTGLGGNISSSTYNV